jgi:hypothetical protein
MARKDSSKENIHFLVSGPLPEGVKDTYFIQRLIKHSTYRGILIICLIRFYNLYTLNLLYKFHLNLFVKISLTFNL